MEGNLFDPAGHRSSRRLARRLRTRRPLVAGAAIVATGYLIVTLVLVAIGLLLTGSLVDGAVGRWDGSISVWFLHQRTATLDALTVWGSRAGDTVTVIAVAAVAVVILSIGRHWAQIGFLVGALLIEVTSFVTTAFLVERRRPTIPHLDAVPPTSSFPSGHTAAAIVLYVGLALVTTSLVRNGLFRAFAWTLAVVLPISVALSRVYRGMHHPSDVIASAVGAAGCLAFALLATRTGVAVAESEHDAAPTRPTAVPIPVRAGTSDLEVEP